MRLLTEVSGYKTMKSSPIVYHTKPLVPTNSVPKINVIVHGNRQYLFTRMPNVSSKQCLEIPLKFTKSGILEVPLSHFLQPKLPNIHKALAPFYVMLVIFGSMLVANVGIAFTAVGFYHFLGNLGVFVTALAGLFYVYLVYKRAERENR